MQIPDSIITDNMFTMCTVLYFPVLNVFGVCKCRLLKVKVPIRTQKIEFYSLMQ